MDTKEFLYFYTSSKSVAVPGGIWYGSPGKLLDTYFGVPWQKRYEVAEAVSKLNFGCAFENNRCVAERRRVEETVEWELGMGKNNPHVPFCCGSCYLTCGNLLVLPNESSILEEVASMFDPLAEGFWRKDVGCILPPGYRSTQCLSHRCEYLRRNVFLDKDSLRLIFNLTNIRTVGNKVIPCQ